MAKESTAVRSKNHGAKGNCRDIHRRIHTHRKRRRRMIVSFKLGAVGALPGNPTSLKPCRRVSKGRLITAGYPTVMRNTKGAAGKTSKLRIARGRAYGLSSHINMLQKVAEWRYEGTSSTEELVPFNVNHAKPGCSRSSPHLPSLAELTAFEKEFPSILRMTSPSPAKSGSSIQDLDNTDPSLVGMLPKAAEWRYEGILSTEELIPFNINPAKSGSSIQDLDNAVGADLAALEKKFFLLSVDTAAAQLDALLQRVHSMNLNA